ILLIPALSSKNPFAPVSGLLFYYQSDYGYCSFPGPSIDNPPNRSTPAVALFFLEKNQAF
ncbi:MAG: hypothetical protein ACPF9D_14280, partial [Owenweeksia sp.]